MHNDVNTTSNNTNMNIFKCFLEQYLINVNYNYNINILYVIHIRIFHKRINLVQLIK